MRVARTRARSPAASWNATGLRIAIAIRWPCDPRSARRDVLVHPEQVGRVEAPLERLQPRDSCRP